MELSRSIVQGQGHFIAAWTWGISVSETHLRSRHTFTIDMYYLAVPVYVEKIYYPYAICLLWEYSNVAVVPSVRHTLTL